jgi:hypothetical protein
MAFEFFKKARAPWELLSNGHLFFSKLEEENKVARTHHKIILATSDLSRAEGLQSERFANIIFPLLYMCPANRCVLPSTCHFQEKVTMGAQYCSWLLGFLLPSLWEAEVAISAAALIATIALLLVLDQTATSPPSSTTEVCSRDSRCRRQRRSRRAKRSDKAAAEPGLAGEVRSSYRPCLRMRRTSPALICISPLK